MWDSLNKKYKQSIYQKTIKKKTSLKGIGLHTGVKSSVTFKPAEENSGIISINGAAAHKADPGDKLIIASYADYDERELKRYHPQLVYVDENNKITISKNSIDIQAA